MFGTFHSMPRGLRFESQQEDETIILFLRQHWITNLPWILASILLVIVPTFLFPLLTTFQILPDWTPSGFITVIVFGWYLASFSYIFVNFILWYFTVGIVTNERVIDIEFVNILNKKTSETRITKIEDVTERTAGFIRGVFDYGDVYVQTAATATEFHFLAVPHPVEVVKVINQLMENVEDRGGV